MSYFNGKSLLILSRAHPDLRRLFLVVGEEANCSIVCSYRGKEAQEEAFEKGFSKAHFGQSPHNYLPALAVDCVPYPSMWSDEKKLKELGAIVKIKAIDLEMEIEWGGNWKFLDYPHYQISGWQKLINGN